MYAEASLALLNPQMAQFVLLLLVHLRYVQL